MAPPSRPSKTVSEIDTCPSKTRSALTAVPVTSRRRSRALGLPKRQPAISIGTSTVPPSMITCPSNSSPFSFTGGAPSRTSSRVEVLLEMKESLAAMISSWLSVRLASITKPLTMCSPADSLITTSLPGNSSVTLARASSIVLYMVSPPPDGSITTVSLGGGGEGGGSGSPTAVPSHVTSSSSSAARCSPRFFTR
eukprot:scaffold34484_cov63-Phaeocystis_antarctica.AAC.10